MRERIEQWLRGILDGGDDPQLDLHIDDIDPTYTASSEWLRGAEECLKLAMELRVRIAPQHRIALVVPLRSCETPVGPNFDSWDQMSTEFDWSPPSLYLLPPQCDWWDESKSQNMTSAYAPSTVPDARVLFSEWFDENDKDCRRSVWVVT